MTTIVCWINREDGENGVVRGWMVGDSRLSQYSKLEQEHTALVDGAIKIFSLPIICKRPHLKGEAEEVDISLPIGSLCQGLSQPIEEGSGVFFTNTYFSHSIGMAYAGSSIVGTNLYLSLMTVTSNLSSVDGYVPSILEISHVAKDIAVTLCDEFFENTFKPCHIEFSIIGFCKDKNDFSLVYVSVRRLSLDGSAEVVFEDCSNKGDDFYILLGDKKEEVEGRINVIRGESERGCTGWWRAPSTAVRNFVERRDVGSIGGYLQAGFALESGCKLVGWSTKFLSIENGVAVGKCWFNIPSIQ